MSVRRAIILSCIRDSESLVSQLPPEVFRVDGLSSPRVRCLLNNLCRQFVSPLGAYVEVGVYNGSTLISAAWGNTGRYIGVEDWSTTQAKDVLAKNLAHFAPHAQLIEGDFRQVEFEGKAHVAFYDADKRENIIRENLRKLIPIVRNGILVVDDVTELGAWQKTEQFLFEEVKALGLRFDLYCKLSAQFTGDVDNWWNGIAVMTFL